MDPLNLAGVIGTWVAAGLAIVALVGIVGPLLLLREKRSERFEALNSIDSQNTGYTRHGLKLRGKDRFFLRVKAPLLKDPPNPEKDFRKTNQLTVSDNARLQKERSNTGWVNLAAIMDTYTSDVPKGDALIIHQKQSWLPVHRFWLLAFGLLGRYSDRDDHGEVLNENNASRLIIEEEVDRKDGWQSNPTAVKLYGSTGTLWWRRKLDDLDLSTDEAYFVPHSEDHAHKMYPEPMPLSQLFWLALGCLPLGSGKDELVFDLATFEPNYDSRPPGQGPAENHFKFVARGSLGISAVHRKWAEAMGVNLEKLCCIQPVQVPPDWATAVIEADANKGPWFRSRNDYLWRSDVYRQILGLLNLHVGPKGALFDHSRYRALVFEVPARKVSRLLDRIHSESCFQTLSPDEAAILGRMRELWPHEPDSDLQSLLGIKSQFKFSRKEAQANYDFDIVHQGRQSSQSSWIRDIVGILTLTSDDFYNTLLLDQPDAILQEIEIAANCVTTKSISGTSMEHTLDFSEIFAKDLAENSTIQIACADPTAVLFSALSACVRAFCFRTSLDSYDLIRLIQTMDEIVHVAARSRIPVLPAIVSTGRSDDERRVAARRRRRLLSRDSSPGRGLPLHFAQSRPPRPSLGSELTMPPSVISHRNTPALTLQEDLVDGIEEHPDATIDGSVQPRRWSSPRPIMPASVEAVRDQEEAEQRAREWYREQGIPHERPPMRDPNIRTHPQEHLHRRGVSPALTATSTGS